jgi:hypothetical protein
MVDMSIITLKLRAGDPSASSGGGHSSSGRGESKVVQLTSANFQKEVLDSPLVSAVACKYLRFLTANAGQEVFLHLSLFHCTSYCSMVRTLQEPGAQLGSGGPKTGR